MENKAIKPGTKLAYKDCFVCGIHNKRGIQLPFHFDGDKVSARFTPASWMIGYRNIIHGGITSSILDEAVVWAVYAMTSRFGMTCDLQIRFRKPLILGETYTIDGFVLSKKRKLYCAESQISDQEANHMAVAKAKIILMDKKDSDTMVDQMADGIENPG